MITEYVSSRNWISRRLILFGLSACLGLVLASFWWYRPWDWGYPLDARILFVFEAFIKVVPFLILFVILLGIIVGIGVVQWQLYLLAWRLGKEGKPFPELYSGGWGQPPLIYASFREALRHIRYYVVSGFLYGFICSSALGWFAYDDVNRAWFNQKELEKIYQEYPNLRNIR